MEISGNDLRQTSKRFELSAQSFKLTDRYPRLSSTGLPIEVTAEKIISGLSVNISQDNIALYNGILYEAFKSGDKFNIILNFESPIDYSLGGTGTLSDIKLKMSAGGYAIAKEISGDKRKITFEYLLNDDNFNTNDKNPLSILEVNLNESKNVKIYQPNTGYTLKNAYWEQMYGSINLPVKIIIENDSIDMNKDGEIDVLDLVLLINKYNSNQ